MADDTPPPNPNPAVASFSDAEKAKMHLISNACSAGDRATVVQLAIAEDGLVSDGVRREACEPARPGDALACDRRGVLKPPPC